MLIPELDGIPAPCPEARFELRWEGRSMGSSWRVRAFGHAPAAVRSRQIGAGIAERLDIVVRQMSHYDPESCLSRFNRAPAASWVELPEEMFRVLRCGIEIASATCGWFDPTLGEAVSLWGFGPDPASVFPTEAAALGVLERCGWRKLRLDPTRRAVWQPGGLQLNFGGIAKGFAVDFVLDWLRQGGLAAALVEIGGELAGFGVKPDGTPWWVELENPPLVAQSLPETLLALSGAAVASSGDWVQRQWAGSRSISHLIDPTTGSPADGPTAGASVIHDSCMIADAWATALCVAPPRLAMRLAAWHGLAARLVFRSGPAGLQEWLSPAMRAMAA
ncbi:MAG: FAD:protein FMN transferase [Bryobacteraceae bacterium]|nr:FAD:protein FMN transferase [Bryobacteraceae bacterium]